MNNKKLYVSKYLKTVPSHRNTSILFNGFTGAIDEVTNDLANILTKRSNEITSELSESEIAFLEKRGHITMMSEKDEEAELCTMADEIDKYKRSLPVETAGLLIIPSYQCNLACPYCFEQDIHTEENKRKVMTIEQVDNLFTNLLDKLYPSIKDKSKIRISLYGGEAFLERNYTVLKRILEHAKKYKMRVYAITNGTRIHKMLDFFGNESGFVNDVQVSFDGGKENHDISRVGHDKKPTFDEIVKNIRLLIEKKVSVDIRINCQQKSLPTLPGLHKRLTEEGILGNPLVKCYVWPVHSNYISSDCCDLDHNKLADFIQENNLTFDTSVNTWKERVDYVINATEGIPLNQTSVCMKTLGSSFLYDPFDNLYSCLDEVARPSQRSGYVDKNSNIVYLKEYNESTSRKVTEIKECRSCPLILMCAGECPTEAFRNNGTIYSPGCNTLNNCFDEALTAAYREKIEGKTKNVCANRNN